VELELLLAPPLELVWEEAVEPGTTVLAVLFPLPLLALALPLPLPVFPLPFTLTLPLGLLLEGPLVGLPWVHEQSDN